MLQELRSSSPTQTNHAICNPFQACDEAIRLTWLLLQADGIDLIPVFEENCQELSVSKDSLKSLVFNFILKSVLQKNNEEKKLSLNLWISIPNSNTLQISLSGSAETSSFPLNQSESSFNTVMIESVLNIPIERLKKSAPIIFGRKARVIADKKEQKQGIESRLFNLGFELTENTNEIDLCFICCKKNEDVIAASKLLHFRTLVLLSNNETYYKRDLWHQITYPLLQNELQEFVVEHFLNNKALFDKELALHRANHKSDLMEEMLTILMDTLPNDNFRINEARKSKDIDALHKIIHRMEGGLLYTGASRLEHSIQCIPKVIKQNDSFNEAQITPLLIELDHHIVELQCWYESRETPSDIS
ncbi:MAG: hypothetical protein JKY88_16440 [Pseudomonadales bacterium]|nr:hypothetical protein [Pseudomonadales bacterium]